MAALPQPVLTIPARMFAWRESVTDQSPRSHLGASEIGHSCTRWLWYRFRWAVIQKFDGRMLRLFSRGQREEAILVEELRGIGAEVSTGPDEKSQWTVSTLGGHFGGSMDGCIKGLPDASPDKWEVIEFKTHSAKSFKDLVAKGVQESKPQHYAQMQVYMALTGMSRANYFAVNKDTDEIHYERVHESATDQKRLMDRAASVVFAPEPEFPKLKDETWFECRFCAAHGLCWGNKPPAANCRTCAHATPAQDGQWLCERHNMAPLDRDHQLKGCSGHRFIPALLENWAEYLGGSDEENWVEYRSKINGKTFRNSDSKDGYLSDEISGVDPALICDPFVQQVKTELGGRVAS